MRVIAHRGSNKEAFENSWSSYEKAIESRADSIELDVFITKDKEVVIVHDAHLRAITGDEVDVRKVDRRLIETLVLPNQEPIPFLDQVLTRILPRIDINIEIKEDTAESAKLVAERVIQTGLPHRVLISSFQPTPLLYLAKYHPELSLAFLWGDFSFSHPFIYFWPKSFMKKCHAHYLHPFSERVTPKLVEEYHHQGWKVVPYVSMKGEDQDKETLWQEMKNCQVDGLCTNYPRELRRWLETSAKQA